MVFIMNNENGEHFCAFIMSFCLKMLLPPPPSQILTELLAQEVGEMGLCRHLPLLPALATPCPGRRGSAGIVGVRVAPMPIFFGGGSWVLQPQPEPEMRVFNYTIKCTIRHNYQCSEPATAHNRHVIYCSLCLYYSARAP